MSVTDVSTGISTGIGAVGMPFAPADSVILHMDSGGAQESQFGQLSPVEVIPIASLLPATSPRLGGEDSDHVRALAGSDATLPPIVVHRGTMRVVDGMHRLRAAVLRGQERLPARFFEGPEQDAFVFAVELNVKHGLPLSTADRAAAVARILRSHPQWSDRAIAAAAGLSARTVCAIRQRTGGPQPQAGSRVGRDGRVRPLSTAVARRQASEFIAEHPAASLREVAAAVGISPGTVRDVRNRLLRGEDPVPPGQRECREPRAAAPHQGGGRPEPRTTARTEAAHPVPEDSGELLRMLSRDPSVRLTENGRYLLRLLATHAVPAGRRGQLAGSVPSHCAPVAAALARHCAASWLDLAHSLDGRQG